MRSATLLGYADAALSVGLDPDEMLASVGLDPNCMEDLNVRIPFDAFPALLAASAAKARCGDFGSRAAMARGLPDYGPVSLALREAETFGHALELYTNHLKTHSDGTLVRLELRRDSAFIRIDIHGETRDEIAQVTQFGTVGVITQLRWLLGGQFSPELVCFAFPRPFSVFSRLKYVECDIVYEQTVSGIVIGRDSLACPVLTSEPRLRRIAMQQLEPVLQARADSFLERVRGCIKQALEGGHCSSERIAAKFAIDRRTLHRRLAWEGESFSSILQQTRVETATHLLGGSDRSLTEIADLLGFESLSSFSRWFQKTFGCNARDWRREKQAVSR